MRRDGTKWWLYGVLSALLLVGAMRFYYYATDDVRVSNMTYQLPFKAPWEVPELTPEAHQQLTHVLSQKFYYIGKGAQSYAFASEDQQYVLKFFKFKHLKPNFLIDLIPSIPPFKTYKNQVIERKKRKLLSVFNGYDLAYRKNRHESQLLYVHLIPTQTLHQHVTIIDKIGQEKVIDLDAVVFLIQRKGDTLRTRLTQLLEQGQVSEAEKALTNIVKMYVSEYQKGLYDRDHGVMFNTGFVGDQPFHLDVGKFSQDESMRDVQVYKKDLEHVVWKISQWINRYFPQYAAVLTPFLELQYQQWTSETVDLNAIDPQRFQRKRRLM